MAASAVTRTLTTAFAGLALAAAAPALPATAAESGAAGVHPDGPFAFGDQAAIAFPAGAYPEEYDWDDMRDVTFAVDSVERSGPESVQYRLVIETPELGRVFGVADLRPQCFADGGASDTPTRLPGNVELESGTYIYALECAVPADARELEIGFDQPDPHGEPLAMVFGGTAEAAEATEADGS
ncbi:hypothetical protein ACFOVU_24370 [Nocardiopsis sediminis]|uniref:Lipoprotein n=1 Tax=Nocardiopsis sediminis TaxID=1778267 RepID=A0ABV8FWP5_9ACTN